MIHHFRICDGLFTQYLVFNRAKVNDRALVLKLIEEKPLCIVNKADLVSVAQKPARERAARESCPSCYQNFHASFCLCLVCNGVFNPCSVSWTMRTGADATRFNSDST